MKKLRNPHQLQKVLADLELIIKLNQDQELKIKLTEHHKREKKKKKEPEAPKEPEPVVEYVDPSIVNYTIEDLDNGSYLVTYKVDDPCEVLIDI